MMIDRNLVKKCVFYLSWSLYVGDEVAGMVVVGAQTPLSLLLVDAVSLPLWQVQEALHGLQVDQQGLWSRARILFLPENLWQQPLQAHTDINSLFKKTQISQYTAACVYLGLPGCGWTPHGQTRPGTHWLAWVHSGPSGKCQRRLQSLSSWRPTQHWCQSPCRYVKLEGD